MPELPLLHQPVPILGHPAAGRQPIRHIVRQIHALQLEEHQVLAGPYRLFLHDTAAAPHARAWTNRPRAAARHTTRSCPAALRLQTNSSIAANSSPAVGPPSLLIFPRHLASNACDCRCTSARSSLIAGSSYPLYRSDRSHSGAFACTCSDISLSGCFRRQTQADHPQYQSVGRNLCVNGQWYPPGLTCRVARSRYTAMASVYRNHRRPSACGCHGQACLPARGA